MKHFVDKDANIFAFEKDGSQDYLIAEDLKELSDDEFKELTTPKKEVLIEEEINKLKYNFELKYKEPTELNGNLFTGGFDSASRLFSKIQYAKIINLDTVVFTSSNDIDIELTIIEAEELYLKLSLDYETKRLEYKEQKRIIENN